jgi:integrase
MLAASARVNKFEFCEGGGNVKHLSPEQVGRLIQAAECDRNRLLFTLLFEHAMRISECLSLTRAHVKRGYLQLKPKKKGKRSDERMNPATLALFERVSANKLPHTLLFPFSRQWASTIFHRAARKAGIELELRMGLHRLRHSAAHALLDRGAPLPVVQQALRHRSIGSTGCYLLADSRDVDQWRARAVMGGACDQVVVQAALASCGQK